MKIILNKEAGDTVVERDSVLFYYSNSKPTHQVIYEMLRDMVICGEIIEGEHIIEGNYAKLFNVSRTPIRVALKKLENQGLVISSKGCMYARGLGIDGINNIFNLQTALERLVLSSVMSNITTNDISQLYSIFDQIHTEISNKNSFAAAKLNESIHKKLFLISAYQGIVDIVEITYGYVQGFNLLAFSDLERQCQITSEHRLMVDALREGDLKSLYVVSEKHIERCKSYSIEKYIQNIKKRKEELELIQQIDSTYLDN